MGSAGESNGKAEAMIAHLEAELSSLTKAVTIINHLAAELDIAIAMNNVRNVALELLDCEKVTLFLIFERRNELRGYPHGAAAGFIIKIKFGEGIAGKVAQTGQLLNIPDAYASPLFNSEVDKATGFRTRNILCCAISDMSAKPVAVLQALNKNNGQVFTETDERNIKLFGTHLGNTLTKAKLHEKAKREKERLASLYTCFKNLNAAGDLGEVLELACDALVQVLHAQHAFVFFMDAARKDLWTQYRTSGSDDPVAARVGLCVGLVGQCAVTRQPLVLNDYDGYDPLLHLLADTIGSSFEPKSVLVQPLLGDQDKVLGVVLVVNKGEHAGEHDIFFEEYFTEADSDAMALFALEMAQILMDRSLEVSLASALSVVCNNGSTLSISTADDSDNQSSDLGGSSWLLRSQLMSMYFQAAPEYMRAPETSSSSSQLRSISQSFSIRGLLDARGSRHESKSSKLNSGGRWQNTISKLLSVNRLATVKQMGWDTERRASADAATSNSAGLCRIRGDDSPPKPPVRASNSYSGPCRISERPLAAMGNGCPSRAGIVQSQLGRGANSSCSASYHLQTHSAEHELVGQVPDACLSNTNSCPSTRDHSPRSGSPMPCSQDTALPAFLLHPPSPGASGAVGGLCSGLSLPCSHQPVFCDPDKLRNWDLEFTDCGMIELVKLCYDMFLISGVPEHFGLNLKVLRNFITAVSSHYHDIPYHNFNHVVHVFHGVWMILETSSAAHLLTPEDRLALLLAALCHDLDHDGYSNSYHVNSQSELARIYNDISVLENHHCAMTFAILRKKDCALLDNLDRDVQRRLRKLIISAIMCTDMSNHFSLTNDVQKHSLQYDPDTEADRQLLIKVVLHAADIGNAVRPFNINNVMSRRVHREFQMQAEAEDKLGLPITISVDSSNPIMCAQVELNFLDYVVTPLWERLAEVLPELKPQFDQLNANRSKYEKLAQGKSLDEVESGSAHASQAHVASLSLEDADAYAESL